jgi:hypothetical protein
LAQLAAAVVEGRNTSVARVFKLAYAVATLAANKPEKTTL